MLLLSTLLVPAGLLYIASAVYNFASNCDSAVYGSAPDCVSAVWVPALPPAALPMPQYHVSGTVLHKDSET